MNEVVSYIVQFIPTIVALIGQISVIAKAISTFKHTKEDDCYKAMVEQNKILIQELKETKRLNKEYLTKIDRIARGE